jgi:hypothetical protein
MPKHDARPDDDAAAESAAEATADEPGLLDDMPPSTDITQGDAATRAEGPGLRQDPPEPTFVPAAPASGADDVEVDTGSPQDYGDPNDDVAHGRSDARG